MSFLWHQISSAVTLIVHGDPYLMGLLWVTVRLLVVSTTRPELYNAHPDYGAGRPSAGPFGCPVRTNHACSSGLLAASAKNGSPIETANNPSSQNA